MVYYTEFQSPRYHQMTIEELLFGGNYIHYDNKKIISSTKTYEVDINSRFLANKNKKVNVDYLIKKLRLFNEATENLRRVNRHDLYKTFYIPKKSGKKWRRIDAPNDELMDALRELKRILENDFKLLFHTSAYAYIKNRCAVDAVKKHQQNESKWFAKLDFSDFFGSTTIDFVMNMLSMIYPTSNVMLREDGKIELEKAIELAFLDGGLPQGTPISPIITNVMMIPVDFKLCNMLKDYDDKTYVYTRYADDIMISSRYDFDMAKIEQLVVDVLNQFGAPFRLNREKSRYGSSAGRNWNLGVMLNKDNEITVGHKKKKQLKSMMYNYITDKRNGLEWDKNDIQIMMGLYSYYKMVEGDTIDAIVSHLGSKLGVDIIQVMKSDL